MSMESALSFGIAIAVAIITIAYYYGSLPSKPQQNASPFPLVGHHRHLLPFLTQLDWFRNGPTIIHNAYRTFPEQIVQLPSTDRQSIVLPLRYLGEISTLPRSISSVSHATSDFFMGTWTTLDHNMFGRPTLDSIRTQCIKNIGQQLGPISRELDYSIGRRLAEYSDWTPVAVQHEILMITAQVIARIVAGPELCRSPEWVRNNIGYAENVFAAAAALKFLPSIMRPLFIALTPYVYRIYRCRYNIRRLISPHIERSLRWRRHQPDDWTSHLKSENDEVALVDWLIEYSPPEEATLTMIAHRLTGIGLGATHTTTNHITNCILDLAAGFDHLAAPLREEIDQVLGPSPNSITSADMGKMWKLDSFMKEVQRFHPPTKLSVNRKLMKPVKLSSGEQLPAGSHIAFAGVPISMDPAQFDNAATFDPFRFERLRKDPKTRHDGLLFTSSYEGTLHFGHGPQMCPGRFLGGAVSKLLLIELLRRYDLRLHGGEGRPANILFGDMDLPDSECKVLFRARQ